MELYGSSPNGAGIGYYPNGLRPGHEGRRFKALRRVVSAPECSSSTFEFPEKIKNHDSRYKCSNCGEFSHCVILVSKEDCFCSKDCGSSFYVRLGRFPSTDSSFPSPLSSFEEPDDDKKSPTSGPKRRPTVILYPIKGSGSKTGKMDFSALEYAVV